MCGNLMTRWQLEFPAFVSWWSDAAQTCLRLDRPKQARELVAEQLGRLGTAHIRTRGISLRVQAAASGLKERPALLRRAVDALQNCGDRLELAYAMADLGHAHSALGQLGQARTMLRRAHDLARRCGAETLRRSLPPDTVDPVVGWEPWKRTTERVADLSDAERRVAALAAQGHTNRQIADRLYVTVSTVEQHLTRVYRKLNVNRRTDLPLETHTDTADSA
jgi:DNA-binding CsgD family transcriptional regulator